MKRLFLLSIIASLFYPTLMNAQSDTIINYSNLWSRYIDPRNVDIWLPPSYQQSPDQHYPVIYMHDGQNLFTPGYSYTGDEWGVDETIKKLSEEGKIKECIVVGIWNTSKRYSEYQPQKPFNDLEEEYKQKVIEYNGGLPVSDNYLKFIVAELKPFIDKNYRTMPDQQNTFIMGSSMGGLISIYGICEYPEIFGGAACLSTHWVSSAEPENNDMGRVMTDYLSTNLPEPEGHKIYFDFGTVNLDSYYQKHQKKVDSVMLKRGYKFNENWISKRFDGADHNEKYWRDRLHIPLQFLLSKE